MKCQLIRLVLVERRLPSDGNHRALKALRQQTTIAVVTLDLEDMLKVLRGPVPMIQRMKQDGQRLGLLRREP